jgi:hypothetical protein
MSTSGGWGPDVVARIAGLRAEIKAAQIVEQRAKEEYRKAKADLEAKRKELEQALDEELVQPRLPLYDLDAVAQATNDRELRDDAPPRPASEEDEADWRAISLGCVGLKPAVVEALNALELFTVGQFADWTAKGGELEGIPGVGPKTAEAIRDRFVEFFGEWSALRNAERREAKANPPESWDTEDAGED